jgi:hypothetical protein
VARSLLTTKLYIPPNRPELVPRPRLIERLNEGLQRKMTLISAPAGAAGLTAICRGDYNFLSFGAAKDWGQGCSGFPGRFIDITAQQN